MDRDRAFKKFGVRPCLVSQGARELFKMQKCLCHGVMCKDKTNEEWCLRFSKLSVVKRDRFISNFYCLN